MLFSENFTQANIKTSETEINVLRGGNGPPVLLLHGYPQTHVMWHKVAPTLARRFTVVCADLRGYGDSSKPESAPDHSTYSKRAMAQDCVEVMQTLGYDAFYVAGHDRGARVAHRMALDYPEKVARACFMDIAPTYEMYRGTDRVFATVYYHWFFLIQPDGLPERLIGNDSEYYLAEKLKRWSAVQAAFDPRAVQEYIRCFSNPAAIHASCEDYRASATIDLRLDKADLDRKIGCPLLVLWGNQGFLHQAYDVVGIWQSRATSVEGKALACGHFLPEEQPETVCEELINFFVDEG